MGHARAKENRESEALGGWWVEFYFPATRRSPTPSILTRPALVVNTFISTIFYERKEESPGRIGARAISEISGHRTQSQIFARRKIELLDNASSLMLGWWARPRLNFSLSLASDSIYKDVVFRKVCVCLRGIHQGPLALM